MKNNGRAKKAEEVVNAVMDALQERSKQAHKDTDAGADPNEAGETAAEGAQGAIAGAVQRVAQTAREAEIADKVDRLLDLIEQNAGLFAAVARRLAGEAATQAPAVAAVVGEAASGAAEAAGEAAGGAAEALGEAAGTVIEAIGEEIVQPATRYGRGLRHGLVMGAAIAILVTPWPGSVVREKLKAAAQEAADLINALREGAADAGAV